jgi:hypothetical protein
MEESDTYLMIREEGEVIGCRDDILIVGEELFGPADKVVVDRIGAVTDLDHLKRMLRRAARAVSWQEILDTP